jgi:Na+-transporting NADH:ubiquinone oxidoreductase subunit F
MIIETILSILVISSIGAALAALISISEYFLANYGPCRINVNEEREFTIDGGCSLLSAMIEEKIFIPSACGGRGTCGLCKLKIHDGAGAILPTEEPFLDQEEIESNVRISCQVKVRQDLKVEIPPELFNVREYSCRCTEIIDMTYDTKLFRFALVEPGNIDYTPGQYMQLLTPIYEKTDEEVYRAYSIASDPNEKSVIDLIIRRVPDGICTTYCFEYLKVGDEVLLNGPYGDFRLSDNDSPMIFIAGGSGMAPFRSLLYHMKNTSNQRPATYFFGGNLVKDLYLTDLMHQFEEELPNFKFVPVVAGSEENNNWSGETGLVTEAVARNLNDISKHEAYLCGSAGMIDASIKVLKDLGVSEENIFYDKFE